MSKGSNTLCVKEGLVETGKVSPLIQCCSACLQASVPVAPDPPAVDENGDEITQWYVGPGHPNDGNEGNEGNEGDEGAIGSAFFPLNAYACLI